MQCVYGILGATLQERGVGLCVLEQGLDTTTAEGRAMFGMLSVLAELQRELIISSAPPARYLSALTK